MSLNFHLSWRCSSRRSLKECLCDMELKSIGYSVIRHRRYLINVPLACGDASEICRLGIAE